MNENENNIRTFIGMPLKMRARSYKPPLELPSSWATSTIYGWGGLPLITYSLGLYSEGVDDILNTDYHKYKGEIGLCFMNASNLAASCPELTYVEGYAISDNMMRKGIPIAFEHAWTVNNEGKIIDPTWDSEYHKEGDLSAIYVGVPYDLTFVRKVQLYSGIYGVCEGIIMCNKENRDDVWNIEMSNIVHEKFHNIVDRQFQLMDRSILTPA